VVGLVDQPRPSIKSRLTASPAELGRVGQVASDDGVAGVDGEQSVGATLGLTGRSSSARMSRSRLPSNGVVIGFSVCEADIRRGDAAPQVGG